MLHSDDAVTRMAQAVESWLQHRNPDVALTAIANTSSVELRYPSSPGPAASILQVVQESRESLRRAKATAAERVVQTEDQEHANRLAAAYRSSLARRDFWPRHDLPAARVVPVTIYLADGATHDQVEAAVEQALTAADLQITGRQDPVIGSWFRRLKANARQAARSSQGQEIMRVAAHGLDQRVVLEKDADITAKLLQHLGPVITSLQSETNAVIRVGAVLIVKVDGNLVVHQLTTSQQLTLDHQPELATSPGEILKALGVDPTNAAPWRRGLDGPDTPSLPQ